MPTNTTIGNSHKDNLNFDEKGEGAILMLQTNSHYNQQKSILRN